jgi:hypothetical protein
MSVPSTIIKFCDEIVNLLYKTYFRFRSSFFIPQWLRVKPTPLFRSIEHLTAHQIPDPPTPFCNILPDLPIVNRENLLITLCTDKSVLHLGCSNYPFTEKKLASGTLLHAKLNKIASRCHGVDCEASSLSILKKAFPSASFFHGNVEELDEREV